MEAVNHAEGGADKDYLDENDGWIVLGPENVEKEKILMDMLSKARYMQISESGAESIEGLLQEFGVFIKTNHDSGDPGEIEPLKVRLKPESIPIRAKQRLYPAPRREFMTRYVCELIKQVFLKKTTAPEFVSAPLIFPKNPLALYPLSLDYIQVNSATIPTF